MVEWNPVEGLKELTWDELRVGDDVIQKSNVNPGSYARINNVQPSVLSRTTKYYLLERVVREPEVRGALAEIYLKGEGGEESVHFFVRTRPKFSDGMDCNYAPPWTDEANNVTKDWNDILNKVKNNSKYVLRTYSPSYKED